MFFNGTTAVRTTVSPWLVDEVMVPASRATEFRNYAVRAVGATCDFDDQQFPQTSVRNFSNEI